MTPRKAHCVKMGVFQSIGSTTSLAFRMTGARKLPRKDISQTIETSIVE